MVDERIAPGPLTALWVRLGRPVVSAVATSAAGLVVIQFIVLVVWGTDTSSAAGPDDAARVGADLWLLAHGATIHLSAGSVDFLPVGLAVLPLLAATTAGHRRAAGNVERLPASARGRRPRGPRPEQSGQPGEPAQPGHPTQPAGPAQTGRLSRAEIPPPWRAVIRDVALVAGTQTVFVLVIALIVSTPAARPDVFTVVVGALAFSLSGAVIGVLSGYGALRSAWRALPASVRVPATAALTAFTSMLAAAAFGVALVLAATLPEIAATDRGLGAGVVGGVGLAAIQLAILPNLVLWALAYTLGPGFAVGGGFVRPAEVQSGLFPDLPVFAALPPGPLPRPGWLVLAVVPLIAGTMLALSVRRGMVGTPHRDRLRTTLVAAGVGGLLLMVVTQLSAGRLGSGSARFGPSGWLVGLAAAAELAAVAVVVSGVAELASRRAGQPFEVGSVRTASLKRRLQSSSSASERATRRHS
ncbi:hypothetical protein ACG83_34850 [Frankia sp. R43]|uniref:cell division protein PerM n=1 Tax=Frankia sp. R43 TaxID=269536 RepID=UPI0006C9FDB1|nr:DUF6350 family protein [Frankia sp. R43]KPM51319.1 hypothetical protein ACG83_34850 [Frankia sp. R43]